MQIMARDFFVRTDDALGEALERQAAVEGRSVSNLIRLAISRYLREAGALAESPATHTPTADARSADNKPRRKPAKK
jgi:hypothetical protein